jgi:ABC-type transporter Mla maintaining outer membrane lipid asymmetry ATPase subunit MlaF
MDPVPQNLPAIEMRNVAAGSMRDPTLVVLEAVNWTVLPEEYWVIAGLQGSGKSDFMMLTAGLMPPLSGDYWFFGEPMPIFEEGRLAQRLLLGMVFETGQLFHHLTVWENVALPLRYHRNLSKADAFPLVKPLLEALELAPWADSTAGTLGRNWQKRVGLARALALKPEVLLVDAPLAGLDLRHTFWWMDFLEHLSKGHPLLEGRRVTLVISTADLRPWKGRPARFATLRNKRFTVLGTWAQVEAESSELVRELFTTDRTAEAVQRTSAKSGIPHDRETSE